MINTYKRFKVGEVVTVKVITECQYYDYPNKGDNNKTIKPGEKAVIDSIPAKVRINAPGTEEYFYNLKRYGDKENWPVLYPVLDYHLLVKI